MMKYIVSLIGLMALLIAVVPNALAEAQPANMVYIPIDENGDLDFAAANIPPQYDISAVAPATIKFVNWLKTFPAVEFSQTFAHKSLYRADWIDGQSVGKVYGAYVWWDNYGVVHIRILMIDPPPVLNNCRTFQPDMFFVNRDGSVPDYDECYLPWYRRWQTRPELDLWYQIQHSKLMQILWADSLREVDLKNPEVIRALERLDLEADGRPPYSTNYSLDLDQLEPMVAQYAQDMQQVVQVQYNGTPSTINVFDVSVHGELSTITSEDQLTTVDLDDLEMMGDAPPNVMLWFYAAGALVACAFMLLFVIFMNRRKDNFDDVRDGIDEMRRTKVR